MDRERRGRSLAEDIYGALRAEILFGRRLPASRVQLNEIADDHGVSLSVVREAVTRLATEELVEATPQRGFRVRPLSIEHLQDLTWSGSSCESLALRESIAKGDVSWEADLVAAHHRLAVTPTYVEDGTGNLDWLTAHSGFHAAAHRYGRQSDPRTASASALRRGRAVPHVVEQPAAPSHSRARR